MDSYTSMNHWKWEMCQEKHPSTPGEVIRAVSVGKHIINCVILLLLTLV